MNPFTALCARHRTFELIKENPDHEIHKILINIKVEIEAKQVFKYTHDGPILDVTKQYLGFAGYKLEHSYFNGETITTTIKW